MLKKKLKNHERIKHILILIRNIILEFWILIDIIYFCLLFFFQINLIFAIKLVRFLFY